MRISIRRTGDELSVRMRLDLHRRRRMIALIALWILTIQGVIVGLWALLAPEPWYRGFPGFGLNWVAMDGPYNHHLSVDVGAFFLAMAVMTAAALFYADGLLARVAGAGWLVFGVPHLLYHLTHRPTGMSTGSFVLDVIAVIALPALGLVTILAAPREPLPLRDPGPMSFRLPRRRNR